MNDRNRITQGQLTLLIVQSQIGVGIFSLPFSVHTIAKGGGWISVLIAGIVTQLIILLMWFLMRRFPSSTVYGICSEVFGKGIGKTIGLLYAAYCLFMGGIVMMSASDVLRRWMLQNTPKWVVLILIAGICLYLIRDSLRRIARAYVLASFLIIPMLLLIAYGNTRANLTYLFPITEAGWWNIVKAVKDSTSSMYGFEILLIAYPFVEGKDGGKLKAMSGAIILTTLFYTFAVLTCLLVFNSEQLKFIPEPVIFLLRSLQLGIVDRADMIFLPIWMTTVVASIGSYFYAASVGIGTIFGSSDHRNAVPIVALICLIVALIPSTPSEIKWFAKTSDSMAYIFIIGLPLLLLLCSLLFKKKEGQTP